jgi:nucleoid DNA-binding protein
MGKLTIQEISKVLVTKNGLEQREANRFATELFAIIQERLKKNDQVKVKGLGTWKVITVEARESISVRTGGRVMIEEHSKITFTPDATMKELVNKPFSQFETVVLNDNVEFDDLNEQSAESEAEFEDIKDDLTEEELMQLEKFERLEGEPPVKEEEPVVQEEEPVVQEEEPVVEDAEEPVLEVEEPIAKKEEPVVEPAVVPLIAVPDETPTEQSDSDVVDEEEPTSRFKWLWIVLGAIALMGLSAFGGYYYGCQQTQVVIIGDTVLVRDTVYASEKKDSANVKAPAEQAVRLEAPKVETPKIEEPKMDKPQAESKPEVDKYAEKDERIRLGAYRIVGLDHEVKVLPGQTFYSICRAHLGPDMECYIEAYNDLPRNPQVKAGQVIKIPKLQLKKRKKQ